jgi:hypothetical protein
MRQSYKQGVFHVLTLEALQAAKITALNNSCMMSDTQSLRKHQRLYRFETFRPKSCQTGKALLNVHKA